MVCIRLLQSRALAACIAVLAALGGIARAAEEARPPNIVLILADDLGYGDLGCYGHPTIRTPNLDRMARQGMRFTEFYSAAEVCTPSRAALLTGRYPIRNGMCHDQFRVLRTRSTGCLPAEEITLAEILKEKGYATACIGKWHLGVWSINPAGHPNRHGFDYFFGLPHSNDMDPAQSIPKGARERGEQLAEWYNSPLYRNEELVSQPVDQTTLTGRYTDEAVKFIEQNKERPFFLYLPHSFPHVPLFASEKFAGKSPRGLYGDVVEELDASVGRVMKALQDHKLAENTLVFFTSDNGPWLIMKQQGGSAGLLREGKGSTWEGGMRVPGIAWWPGKIKVGSVCRDMASTMDLFTTAVKLSGAELPGDRVIDGLDLSETLFQNKRSPRTSYLYYRGTRLMAARQGRLKAHFLTQAGYGQPKADEHDPPLVFDVKTDPGETFNIADQQTAFVEAIGRQVEKHEKSLTPAESQLEQVQQK